MQTYTIQKKIYVQSECFSPNVNGIVDYTEEKRKGNGQDHDKKKMQNKTRRLVSVWKTI